MRLVVTLSTVPGREAAVLQTLESLRKSTVFIDCIYINIPTWYPRFNRAPHPDLIPSLTGATVIRCKDYGAFTKLIPILDIETDSDTLIIIVDDDRIYTPHFIEGLVRAHVEFRCAVGYSGIRYPEDTNAQYAVAQSHGTPVDILEGSSGILIRRDFMNGFKMDPLHDRSIMSVYLSDDYVYARFLDYKGISKKICSYRWAARVRDDWSLICTEIPGTEKRALSSLGFNLDTYIQAGIELRRMNNWRLG